MIAALIHYFQLFSLRGTFFSKDRTFELVPTHSVILM